MKLAIGYTVLHHLHFPLSKIKKNPNFLKDILT